MPEALNSIATQQLLLALLHDRDQPGSRTRIAQRVGQTTTRDGSPRSQKMASIRSRSVSVTGP